MNANVSSFLRPVSSLRSRYLLLCLGVASGCDEFTCADYATCPVESDGGVSSADVPDAAPTEAPMTGAGTESAATSSHSMMTGTGDATANEFTEEAGQQTNTVEPHTEVREDGGIATEALTGGTSANLDASTPDSELPDGLPIGDASAAEVDAARGKTTDGETGPSSVESEAPDASTTGGQPDDVSAVDASCDGALCTDDAESGPVCGDGVVDAGEACDASAPWCRECQIVPAIGAGAGHTCALSTTGGVKCWGAGTLGRLGNGDTVDQPIPVDVTGLDTGVVAIDAGPYHTCAVLASGAVRCWGMGDDGQLGNNDTSDQSVPVDVIGLSGEVTALAAGDSHTCALMTSGAVKCWGSGALGQLGNGSNVARLQPVNVTNLDGGAAAITAGNYHTCALMANGGVKCWGYGTYGQLGNSETSNQLVPVDVAGLESDVLSVTAGDSHTCALMSSGAAKCWGNGNSGRLGNNDVVNQLVPVGVDGLTSGLLSVAGGGLHSCAVLSSGGVKCWGYGFSGQLGNNSTSDALVPVDVLGLSAGVVAVAAGFVHSCALMSNGTMKCWGDGSGGKLGNSFTGNELTPVDVIGLP